MCCYVYLPFKNFLRLSIEYKIFRPIFLYLIFPVRVNFRRVGSLIFNIFAAVLAQTAIGGFCFVSSRNCNDGIRTGNG